MSQHFRQIDHPLRRGGLSRPERDNPALPAETAPVDGRGMGDLLRFWYDYARQINFYEARAGEAMPTVTGDWLDFFRRSIPFQYANIGAYDLDGLEARFVAIRDSIERRRTLAALNPLFDLLLEMAGLLATWKGDLTADTTGLQATIQGLIDTSLRDPVTQLLGLANGAARWGYRPGIRLGEVGTAFGMDPLAVFAVDRSISGRRGSPKNKVFYGRDILEELYRILWKGLEATVEAASDDGRLEASLREPETADTPPSLGLVYAFLLLFREAQGGLNQLSGKHLNFFYRKTLLLKELPLVEDRAHLVFELGKQVKESLELKQGLRFKAGKDASGQEIVFELPADLILTKAQVADVKTFYIDPEDIKDKLGVDVANIYAAPVANSGDGLGEKFPKGVPLAWPTVGGSAAVYPDPETERATPLPVATLAFVLASPVLLLREGLRKITVTLTLGPVLGTLPAASVLNSLRPFVPYLSTEDGWLEVSDPVWQFTVAADELEVRLTLTLAPDYPAVLHPEDDEVLPLVIPQRYPALKMDFRTDLPQRRSWYCRLGQLAVKAADIEVTVCGLRQLVVENDLAALDPAKPFPPFGPVPKQDSSHLYVGSEEVFAKAWSRLDLRLNWQDLPDFTGYYDCYPGPPFVAANVKIDPAIRNNYRWAPAAPAPKPLITGGDATLPDCPPAGSQEIVVSLTNDGVPPLPPCPWPLSLEGNISSLAPCGVLRLRLTGDDFRHDGFAQAILNAAAKNETITVNNEAIKTANALIVFNNALNGTNNPLAAETELVVLNPPYTPQLAGVSIDYRAGDTLDGDLLFGHLHPWENSYEWMAGGNAGAMSGGNAGFPLLATFLHEGYLYVGLADYQPGELIHLYFELDAPTADPRLPKAEVQWAYLRGNDWTGLQDETQVLSDTTEGLIRPGIVQIAVPSDISRKDTTVLPAALHWLRATVPTGAAAIAATLRVSTQVAEVIAVTDPANDAQRLSDPLPEGSIAKVLAPVGGLKGIEQPYPTYGGRAPEDTARFDRRVSELLKHKDRAITLNDYESLVMEAFPRVYRVKCLTHTRGVRGNAEDDLELAPGFVTLVVVPDVRLVSAVNPFEPRLPAAELEEIRQYVSERSAPCAAVNVLNPEYETVRLTLCVRFHPGKSTAFYRKKLQEDLRSLLAPWTRAEAGADISFGGRFYHSTAVHFVEELDYVDFVRDLRILVPGSSPLTSQPARHARSVLTTVNGSEAADQHHITVLED
ncbi:hypothetical protein GGR26_002576 [Lewinella marina]|uniref:Baseplate protein J-like domain-containing protein n=1 Tax=Neolewinella marina TaxID=438751 RepID=A0A2G0CB20_9BACT|nr:baseplate J/gp47 family protein [Neolewinella marina]NJB86799.1 hypothetical protein [Neolewinella marina]PHK97189.1 hypothetical protein CGL56_17260 [Neolewinella marina]